MKPLIARADARLLPLAADSVDLVVTSPPYWALRDYTDDGQHLPGQLGAEEAHTEYLDHLLAATAEMVRVLKPTGSLWINLGDKYATRYASRRGAGRAGLNGDDDRRTRSGQNETGVPEKSLIGLPWRYALRGVDELGLTLRSEVIWEKPNGLPESVTDRVRRSHETWFHFTLGRRYYADLDPLRSPASDYRAPSTYDRGLRGGARPRKMRDGVNPAGRLPGSVWSIPTQPLDSPDELGVEHYAAFPMEWPRRIITGWCPPDGVVLDPFGGTGTTALVADALGRRGLSFDLSGDYCRLARWRTSDPREIARALQIDAPPAVPHGVDPLFDLDGAAS